VRRAKILIDCDPGHDDAVAILYAARHCELLGITTVHGNQTIEHTTRNALALLEIAGIDVPVARGCARPLLAEPVVGAYMHGETGLDGADLPPPQREPIALHAVDFIIETARAYQGELVLAVIGPQTNVAMALRREPRLSGWLREITIMGGSTDRGNVTPAAEFNIHIDPEAASVVYDCGAPVRMVGLNVTRHVGVSEHDIGQLKSSRRRVARACAGFLEFYLGRQRAAGRHHAVMHDVCAIVPHVDDGLIDYHDAHVAIELAGTHTRGMTVCDFRAGAERKPNAKVAVDARGEKLMAGVMEALSSYD